jgi:hypothetical protein
LHHLLLAGLPAHSGLPRSTDILSARRHVSKVSKGDTASLQRAPFNVHDVEQVVVFPWSHLMQTATH